MRTLRLTKLASLLTIAVATSMFAVPAAAGPIVMGLNNTKKDSAVPLGALLETSEMNGKAVPNGEIIGVNLDAAKEAMEAWHSEKRSAGATLYVSVDRKRKKVKVDAVGQVHITDSFMPLLALAPKGYAMEFNGKGISIEVRKKRRRGVFPTPLIKKAEGLAGMRITVTGGSISIADTTSVLMPDSSLTVNGGSFNLPAGSTLEMVDSTIAFEGRELAGKTSATTAAKGADAASLGKAAAAPAAPPVTGPQHSSFTSGGNIILSNSTLTSTTGFTWEPSSLVVFDGKAELVGVESLPGGKSPGDITCGDGDTCLHYDRKRRKYKLRSGIVYINVYQSDGDYKVAPPAGTSWATHLDALVEKSAEK